MFLPFFLSRTFNFTVRYHCCFAHKQCSMAQLLYISTLDSQTNVLGWIPYGNSKPSSREVFNLIFKSQMSSKNYYRIFREFLIINLIYWQWNTRGELWSNLNDIKQWKSKQRNSFAYFCTVWCMLQTAVKRKLSN